ncbi:hypothetical protein JCM8547_003545 [Rhodosporidiobolus lusitaniae]
MGCSQSSSAAVSAAEMHENKQSQMIDEELKRARREQAAVTKALLLGAGESGKSTIVKQMRLIYAKPYSEEERLAYREIVFANTVQSAQAVLAGYPLVSLPLPPSLAPIAALLNSVEADSVSDPSLGGGMRPQIAEALRAFWAEETTKKVVEMSARFQLNDSASYFFDSLPRLSSSSYIPTTADVLRTRVVSTGIVEETFEIKALGRKLLVVDVGGQRSERKKWIHCFENVQVMLFVVAISEYPQKLYEDNTVNRLDEAAQLWESIAGSRWFRSTTMVLFLNKLDLFTQKITSGHYPLASYMPDYTGPPSDVEASKRFMKAKFTELSSKSNPGRALYSHFTQATDTESTKVVLSAVMNSVLTARLDNVGLL